MVIKSMPVGERDRRVTLMTMEQGKLSFFARGAGKPGSPFMGVTRPFSYGKFSLFQGRDSYSLEGAEIVNYFEKLSADLVTTCYATYFLELADYYAREFAPEPGILKHSNLGSIFHFEKSPTSHMLVALGAHSRKTHSRGFLWSP